MIKMFAEHISLKFTENEIVVSAKRLWTVIIQSHKHKYDLYAYYLAICLFCLCVCLFLFILET